MLRPALPNWPACVRTFSRWNASRLIHASTECGPAFGSPTRLGRLAAKPEIGGLLACSATLAESDTVKGVPEFIEAMALSCQPSNTVRTADGAPSATCACHDTLATNRCRASNSDGPYSDSR